MVLSLMTRSNLNRGGVQSPSPSPLQREKQKTRKTTMTNQQVDNLITDVELLSAKNALAKCLETYGAVSKSTLYQVGIQDPNRTVNRLREEGWEIETITHKSTPTFEGETFYSII